IKHWKLKNPDTLAIYISSILHFFPKYFRSFLLFFLILLSFASLIYVHSSIHPLDDFTLLKPIAFIFVIFIIVFWLTCHELAHATMCRFYGYPIAGAGLAFRGFILPSAYVNTSSIQLSDNWKLHFQVAMAGPFIDLIFAGFSAIGMIITEKNSTLFLIFEYSTFLILLGLLFNLTPFRASDGNSALYSFFKHLEENREGMKRKLGFSIISILYFSYAFLYLVLLIFLFKNIVGF
ncbi:hypothetical protein NRA58_18295, partial [Acinetobacter baumannii]|nr:hypothetical protein [Acinetobacter baumannii]